MGHDAILAVWWADLADGGTRPGLRAVPRRSLLLLQRGGREAARAGAGPGGQTRAWNHFIFCQAGLLSLPLRPVSALGWADRASPCGAFWNCSPSWQPGAPPPVVPHTVAPCCSRIGHQHPPSTSNVALLFDADSAIPLLDTSASGNLLGRAVSNCRSIGATWRLTCSQVYAGHQSGAVKNTPCPMFNTWSPEQPRAVAAVSTGHGTLPRGDSGKQERKRETESSLAPSLRFFLSS